MENNQNPQNNDKKRSVILPVCVVICVCILGAAAFFTQKNDTSKKETSETAQSESAASSDTEQIPEILPWDEDDQEAYDKFSSEEKSFYDNCVETEPEITEDVVESVTESGGEMAGLEFRLKTPSSLYEKLYERPDDDDAEIEDMKDIIRYTEIDDESELAENTQETLDDLKSEGYVVLKVKNTWTDEKSSYKGINTQLQSEDGQMFELQFHTQESFDLKNGEMHTLYEKARVLDPKSEEYLKLEDQMFELSEQLEVPDDIEKIKNYEKDED